MEFSALEILTLSGCRDRMNEITGLKALLEFQLESALKLWQTVGTTDIGDFEMPIKRLSTAGSTHAEATRLAPEWSPDRGRDRPYAPDIKMNDALDVHNPLFDLWRLMRNT